MKIDFSQIELNKNRTAAVSAGQTKNTASAGADALKKAGVYADISDKNNKGALAYGKKTRSQNTLADSLDDLDSYNEKTQRNYMAVMSNTLSDKDYEELVKNGYAPGQMEVKDAVTSLDRMKVKLAQAGVDVKGYTDTVSSDKVEEITGSAAAAAGVTDDVSSDAVSDALEKADLPVTDDNVKGVQEASAMSAQLKPINDAAAKYMVENSMEPTIANVYEAQYSAGSALPVNASGSYFSADDTGSYFAKAADNQDITSDSTVMTQIDTVIEDAGLQVTDETQKDAQWLVQNGIPLNKDTLSLYEDIKSADTKADISEITSAIADGRKPTDAYLIKNYKDIKAERQLKETELAMTADANIKLVKSDYSVDTSALENEVEGLKSKEKKVWDLLDETLDKVSSIRSQPADILGSLALPDEKSAASAMLSAGTSVSEKLSAGTEKTTLNELHEAGTSAAKRYEAAQQTYEAVGTEVRPDLGDNIQKAFRNVDDILQDMEADTSDENRRAVRILGYNSMEITSENIDKVKAADTKVNSVLDSLTPKNVLKLIRENVNPLETDLDTLSEKLDGYNAADEQDSVKFSDYIVKLQNAGQVTEDEAASYIGVYRLVDTLVRSDGAAVGALVNQDADVNMKNLLSAVRTKKKGGVDIQLTQDFAGLMAAGQTEDNQKIDTQIQTAFSGEDNADSSSSTQKFVNAAKVEEYVYHMLQNSDVAVTADNVNAAAMLMSSRGSFIKGLYDNTSDESKERIKKAADDLLDSMDDGDSTREAYDELTDVEELASVDSGKLDLRLMQSYHKVISLQKSLADSENYEVPIKINGEITSINLQIRHGEIGGKVDITCESESLGKLAASFSVSENTTEGTVACSSSAGEKYVQERIDYIADALSQDGRGVKIGVVRSEGLNINRPVDAMDGEGSTVNTADLYRTAKAFIGGIFHEDQQQYNGISDK